MFDNEIFDKWLDKEAERVIEKLTNNEKIENEDKLILMLKAQTNHFYHLDKEIRSEIELFKEESKKYWEENEKRWKENEKRWEENENRWKANEKRWEANEKRWEENEKRWRENDKRWEENQKELKRIYETINSQTWKIIGTIGTFIAISQFIGSYIK